MSTSYERGRNAEETAREWLQKKYDVSFSKRNLEVGSKFDGRPAMHSFDLVSEDNQIVAEVKSHQLTKSGNTPSGKISDTYQACFMLEKVGSKKKLLILTDPNFYAIFKRYSEGKVSREIDIVLLANNNEDKESSNVRTMSPRSRPHEPERTSFDVFWTNLTSWLSNRQHITNWTANSGEIGEGFSAVYVGGNYIIVYPKSAGVQRVPKKDLKVIYEKWDEYAERLIPRCHFVKGPIARSRFAKYTISLIHLYFRDKESKKM